MSNLDYQQVFQLSKKFSEVSFSIQQYREKNFSKLSAKEDEELEKVQSNLIAQSNEMLNKSAALVINDAQSSLDEIFRINTEIGASLNKLKKIQDVIGIVTVVVQLGAAIISLNPEDITENIGGLKESWDVLKPS